MKNILLLTDFDDLSDYARSLSDKIAANTKAELHVLKIVNLTSDVELLKNGELQSTCGGDVKYFEQELSKAKTQMQTWCAGLQSSHTCKVEYGRLLNSILSYVKEHAIDLIVMGTHGAFSVDEKVSGSVTENLILKTSVPVLSIKCSRETIDFSDFLITGDFATDKPSNLDTIKSLQGVFNSSIHLLCVNTPKQFVTTEESFKQMRTFAELNALENVQLHIQNANSKEDGIVNFANNYDATHDLDIDIIAIEKKDKSQLGYMLTGCEATSFVNHIYRPLITYTKVK